MSEQAQEEQQQTTDVEVPATPTAEEQAREGGWVPKEEWGGDAEEWVDAREFNRRGEYIDTIKRQNKEIKRTGKRLAEIEQSFAQFQEHARKVAKQEFEDKLKQLKQVKKEALEGNDTDLVVEVDDKILDLKAEQKQAEAVPDSPKQDPQIASWLEDNSWYEDDPVMRGAADALATDVRAEMPKATPREILDEVGKRVQSRFNVKTKRANVTPITEQQQGGATPSAKSRVGPSRLSPDQRRIGERFVKQGALKNLKEYAQQLYDIGELN